MGEAKRREGRLTAMLGKPCIYCAGQRIATTIDHMPPRSIFTRKHRPRGLEFPSCEPCNGGTKATDQVAAMLSRVEMGDLEPPVLGDLRKYLSGVSNNENGLLEELYGPADWRESVKHRVPDGQHPLYVAGPLVSHHMEVFSAKFGFAMYAEKHGGALPAEGAVAARWYSNADALEGIFPADLWSVLSEPRTLEQGRFRVSEQFEYYWAGTEDGALAMFVGTFRRAFAVLAFTAKDESKLRGVPRPTRLWRPGDFVDV